MEEMPEQIDLIRAVIDSSDMPQRDKSLVLASLWTGDEVPAIISAEHHAVYAKLVEAIENTLGNDGRSAHAPQFLRSKPGLFYAALTSRMIEYEDRGASDD